MIARWVGVVMAVCTVVGVSNARAEKPKPAEAKAALAAWQKTLAGKAEESLPGMGVPFRIAAYKDANELTCDLSITDRAKLVEARKCIDDANVYFVDLKPYKKSLLRELGQLSDHKAEIEKLETTTVMFGKYERGEGMAVFTIVALAADPSDHKPRVVAVFAWTILN